MGMNFYIATEYLRNRHRQSVLSLLGIMMGVAFFIAISAMMNGMHTYFIDLLVQTVPHVKIMDEYRDPARQPVEMVYGDDAAIDLQGVRPKEENRGIRNAEQIMQAIGKLEGLRVTPTLEGQVFLRYGGKDVASVMVGIDPVLHKRGTTLESDMISGSLDDLLTTGNGVILGRELAKKLGISQGDKVTVTSTEGVIRVMRVTGIFDTGVTEVDQARSYVLLKHIQTLQRQPDTINQIGIRMDDFDAAPELAEELERRYTWRAESWQETFSNIFQLFFIQNIVLYSTVSAILLVAGFGIFNIISTSVHEKSRDIAILKSMGFAEGDISRIFIWQGILLGVVGTVLGWGLGYVFMEYLSSIEFTMEGESIVDIEGFPMYRSWTLYAWGGALAMVSSTISAWLPARKAASFDPVAIIRGTA